MSGFAHEISTRIANARENLRLAHEADEPYLAEVHLGELESLARIASEHGVSVEVLPDAADAAGTAGQPLDRPSPR